MNFQFGWIYSHLPYIYNGVLMYDHREAVLNIVKGKALEETNALF